MESGLSTILNRFRQTRERLEGQPRRIDEQNVRAKVETTNSEVRAEGLSALPQHEPEPESEQVEHALEWPVVPKFVDPKKTAKFESLGVSSELCTRLGELGFKQAFAVQCEVIPRVLKAQKSLAPDPPSHILVNSFTGSGKTLAYAVPVVDALKHRRIPRVRALILLPTKVLIQQVVQIFELLVKGTGLQVLALKPERTLTRELKLLTSSTPDILVCAPGRLVEHLQHAKNLLSDLQLLVVDEADRLLGQNFQNWTQSLQAAVYTATHAPKVWKRPPQRLVFSATLTRDPSKLAMLQVSQNAVKPTLLVVGKQHLDGNDEFALPSQLLETLVRVRSLGDKPLVLVNELVQTSGRVLVFVRSNEAAARLSRLISLVSHLVFHQTIDAQPCSGEMRVQDRRRVLKEFEAMASGVLVCTDIIARGIDMPIDVVVNYDVPNGAREYVHRVGRTARANTEGQAWTLVAPGYDTKQFEAIQKGISRAQPVKEYQVDPEVDMAKYEEALRELQGDVMGV